MTEQRLREYIDSYYSLLVEKGYSEAGLSNGKEEGSMKKNIEAAFKEGTQARPNMFAAGIIVTTFGKMGPQKEMTGFAFTFIYKPEAETIDLVKLESYNKSLKAEVILSSNFDLPSSSMAYEALKEAEKHQAMRSHIHKKGLGPS